MAEILLVKQVLGAPWVAWIRRPLSLVQPGSLSQRCLRTLIADWPVIYDASSDVTETTERNRTEPKA
jgi:hypothetical protein